MEDNKAYAVFFFPQALEALGEAIKPYLQGGPAGEHLLCREIDTGGALIEMTLSRHTEDGHQIECELMVPSSMVRMVVSARSDGLFGFGPRMHIVEPGVPALPPIGPTAPPAEAPPHAIPAMAETTVDVPAVDAPAAAATPMPPKP